MHRNESADQYSIWVGLIYIFNLIVGTGALALPAAFARAGWGLGTTSVLVLAVMSFLNATYVIETMACANAVIKWRRLQALKRDSIQDHASDEEPLSTSQGYGESEEPLICGTSIPSRYYSLDRRVELGEMAHLFLNRAGRTLFYCILCVYLYGDLAIYSAAVAKSVVDVMCGRVPGNVSSAEAGQWVCMNGSRSDIGGHADLATGPYTRHECYRGVLLAFLAAMGPFVFFNVQKTKYLQLFTTGMRWLAFTVMVSMAIQFLASDGARGKPAAFDWSGMPTLFGAGVYSFMCHHSLPGLVTPIGRKTNLGCYLSLDYVIISVFYLLLAFTGAFAFEHLEDLYTLNFVPDAKENIFLEIVHYFLALFPVLTLSASFPIIAITLRNNLQSMFLDTSRLDNYNIILRKLLFPAAAVAPPVLVTYYLDDLRVLIEFTGAYAGSGIQYVIPTLLVLAARRHTSALLGLEVLNEYRSPFGHVCWAVFVLLWSFFCIVLVSLDIAQKNS